MARELIVTTSDKKKVFRAVNQGAYQLKDFPGLEINVTDIIQIESQRKETGEEAINTVLIADSGEAYATLSPTVDDSIHNLVGIFGAPTPEEPIRVRLCEGKSNAGRAFLYLDIV